MKATEHEPERRYASAGALADDVERHLDGQPVAAHPPSSWYRTRKFVARHRGGVATTAAFLLAILAALGFALWQANVARQQARLAHEQAARAEAVRDLLVDIFDAEIPSRPKGEMPGTAELLERGAQRAKTDLGGDAGRAERSSDRARPRLRSSCAARQGRRRCSTPRSPRRSACEPRRSRAARRGAQRARRARSLVAIVSTQAIALFDQAIALQKTRRSERPCARDDARPPRARRKPDRQARQGDRRLRSRARDPPQAAARGRSRNPQQLRLARQCLHRARASPSARSISCEGGRRRARRNSARSTSRPRTTSRISARPTACSATMPKPPR